jgi:hypothetical protein
MLVCYILTTYTTHSKFVSVMSQLKHRKHILGEPLFKIKYLLTNI